MADQDISKLITAALIEKLRSVYQGHWDGIHGFKHWLRVRENGLRLAESSGANTAVVELFAFIHDSQRHSDAHDPLHGPRAAQFIDQLQGGFFNLSKPELELLRAACANHTFGLPGRGDVTVLTCWDADRLDIGRVGDYPKARFLSTPAAKDPAVIEWAYRRSIEGF